MTGGVYKGQGRIRGGLMTRPYEAFRVHEKQLQSSIPTELASAAFGSTCRHCAMRVPANIV